MSNRIMPIVMLTLGLALGVGGAFLVPMFWPKPPPPPPQLLSAWRLMPLSPQTPLAACKQGYARAFQSAGLTEIVIEPGDGIQVLARADGYIALGLCMLRREAALAVVSGPDISGINNRLNTITAVAMGSQPAQR